MNDNFITSVNDTVETMTRKLVDMIDNLTNDNIVLQSSNKSLQNQIDTLEKRVEDMSRDLLKCEEEQREFLKVSRVVAIEKDNSRLRCEINQLQEQLKQKNSDTRTQSTEAIQSTQLLQPVGGGEIDNDSQEHEETFNVIEKHIKGVVYYVSDNNDVYIKNSDETVGDLVGKIDGKKVKWM
jgi:predicted RNase H-like nuclease (RuvC/YqgF family)